MSGRLLALALPALWLVGCEQPAPPPPPPPTVTVAKPVVRDVTRYDEYTGNTASVNRVDVVARVPGILEKQTYDVLDDRGRPTVVAAGDVLFEIEHEQYEIARDAAEANVKRSEALEKAALSIFNKVTVAHDKGATTEAELIEAEAAYEQRVAETKAAQAELRDAELDLSYTFVEAPITGEVSRNVVDIGTYVGGNGPTVLTRVTQMQPIYVYFDVSEKILTEYLERAARVGRNVHRDPPPVELAIASDPSGTFPRLGQVDWWDRSVDRGTGTIVVRGRLPNEDGSLVPGLFARVRVPSEELEDAVLIREDAIGTDLSGKFVLLVEPGEGGKSVVKKQPITLLMRTDDGLRVVEGLAPDASYIVEGVQKARPGAAVNVEQASATPPAPPAEAPEAPAAGDAAAETPEADPGDPS